ncbi:alkaline phosphatase PhoX [Aurantiacibacter gilvus]|uniref:Alkaline phosphatase PhoX n=1 Tax=Aurantiacibacter gilvus TaxID=3139141 RepID=A0ABU9IFW6_9SPHN
MATTRGYGELVPDPAGIVDLPEGFSYRVISRLGDQMDDGFTVPDDADGMGCFDLGNGEIGLVRNHELSMSQDGGGVVGPAYDTFARSLLPLPGGTTTVVLDERTLEVKRQYRSLAGTINNCAGGVTPWGSWLSCEEDVTLPDGRANRDHGYVFEVPADAPGLVDPVPLKAMGRFKHEAACVDPATGAVYMTEHRDESLLYRFIPNVPGRLAEGGRLQALAIAGIPDTTNYYRRDIELGDWHTASWVDLDNPEAPDDDLRFRGAAAGASIFHSNEGIHMGEGEFYFCATYGGAVREGQIFRVRPGRDGEPDMVQLFFETADPEQFSFGDNLTIAPNGHLMVCEDQYNRVRPINHIRGITRQGAVYPFARMDLDTEWAGVCYAPDGQTMFVNIQRPTMTLAITGPWLPS